MTGEILCGRSYLLSRHGALSFFLSLFSDEIFPPDFFSAQLVYQQKGPLPWVSEGTALIFSDQAPVHRVRRPWASESKLLPLFRPYFREPGTRNSLSRWPWTIFYSWRGPLGPFSPGSSQPPKAAKGHLCMCVGVCMLKLRHPYTSHRSCMKERGAGTGWRKADHCLGPR